MKKLMTILCAALLMFSLTACSTDYNGIRVGNANKLEMEYKPFNKTDTHKLEVDADEAISVKLILEGGSLGLTIQKDDNAPIYQSSGLTESCEFTVNVTEAGTYTVTQVGNEAVGRTEINVVKQK